jgi:DNA-binding transcriptional LysR family regulator
MVLEAKRMRTQPASPSRLPLNLHLQQLNYVRAVAGAKTLQDAARELNVSQPALSQALDEIERRLGLVLFERVGRRRRLNQDGLAVADFAAEILARAERFAMDLRRRQEGEGGELQLFLYGPEGRKSPRDDDDWVHYPARSHTREKIDRELAARGWTPRVRLESSNPQVLRQMVSLGFGWSVLPRAVAESGPAPLKPARVRPVAKRRIVVSRRKAAGDDARAVRFLELARAWARREQGL